MKIVVTNPAGFSEKHIALLSKEHEVVSYSDSTSENIAERLSGADAAVIDCFLTPITKELLESLPSVKFICLNSTGFDKVDIQAVRDSGKILSNVPGFSTEAVAEMAIGLMFAAARKIPQGDRAFRDEKLIAVDPGTPAAERFMGLEFSGKTLGVVGLGAIGTRVAEMGRGLGMRVVAYNRTPKSIPGVEQKNLEQTVAESDVLTVCLAVNDETKGLLSRAVLARLKSSSVVVCIAGMQLFEEGALREMLDSGAIAAAGLDTADESWIRVRNTVLTPHMAYDTREAEERMAAIISKNIEAFARGTSQNVVC